MTTPVEIRKEHPRSGAPGERYTMRFVLGSKYTTETAPRPQDPQVRLTTTPPKERLAAVEFTGACRAVPCRAVPACGECGSSGVAWAGCWPCCCCSSIHSFIHSYIHLFIHTFHSFIRSGPLPPHAPLLPTTRRPYPTHTGFATEGEVQRQLLRLLSALDRDGVNVPDASSYRILQYNPPYTLPWLRRNELLVVVSGPPSPVEEAMDGMGAAAAAAMEAATGFAEEEEGGMGEEEGGDDDSSPSDY
jgi:hypothetical protein